MTDQQANGKTTEEVTAGPHSPAAWSADDFSRGGTGGNQSMSRSSLCLQKKEKNGCYTQMVTSWSCPAHWAVIFLVT